MTRAPAAFWGATWTADDRARLTRAAAGATPPGLL